MYQKIKPNILIKESKNERIDFRISSAQKTKWKNHCNKKKIYLTDFIISSVENKIASDERRSILKFIEKQDNIFSKVENNINQFAKVANANKNVSEYSMNKFLDLLEEVQRLKKEQNEMVKHIYKLIANDS